MALKIIKAGAEEYGATIKMLLAGDPGSGKTRHPSCWPNPFYLSAEGGLMSVSDRAVPAVKVTTIAQIQEALALLRQAPKVREQMMGIPVDTVIIDTLDEVWRILCKERLTEKRQESMQQADWGYCGEQLRTIVRSFRNLEMNVVFTCHVKETRDEESGKVTVRPQIQGAMGDEIPAYVDLAVLLTARPATVVVDGHSQRVLKRLLQTYPDANHPWIKDRSGRLPMEFEIDFDTDYERMHAAIFGNQALQGSIVVKEAEAFLVDEGKPAAAPPPPAKKPTKAAAKKAATLPAEFKAAPAPVPPVPARSVDADTGEIKKESVASAPTVAVEPLDPAEMDAAVARVLTAVEAKPEPEPEPEATAEVDNACESCGTPVESVEQWDLSFIRFRKHLCRACFKQPVRK